MIGCRWERRHGVSHLLCRARTDLLRARLPQRCWLTHRVNRPTPRITRRPRATQLVERSQTAQFQSAGFAKVDPICPSTHRHRAHADRPQRRRLGPWFVRTVTGLAAAPSSTSTRFHSCGPVWRDWRQRLVEVWLGLSSMPFRVRKAAAKSLLMLRLTRLSATRKNPFWSILMWQVSLVPSGTGSVR